MAVPSNAHHSIPGVSQQNRFRAMVLEALTVEQNIPDRCRWSAVSRTERYNRRRGTEGGDQYVDKDNPLPTTLDPITLEPVVTPAISPYGHVMGIATWKVSACVSKGLQCVCFPRQGWSRLSSCCL